MVPPKVSLDQAEQTLGSNPSSHCIAEDSKDNMDQAEDTDEVQNSATPSKEELQSNAIQN